MTTPFDDAERRIWSGRAEVYARPVEALLDAVLANFVLNHVGRPLAALTELRRITRPGGRVAVTIWRAPGAPGQTLIGRAAQAAGLARPAWLPALDPADDFPRTPEGLAALLAAAGFLEATCSEVAWDHETGAEEWWAGAEQGIGAIGQVLNSRGSEGMAEARRAYDGLSAEFRTPSGQLVLPHVALLAAGTA